MYIYIIRFNYLYLVDVEEQNELGTSYEPLLLMLILRDVDTYLS